MKFAYTVPLFVAAAIAQDASGVIVPDPATLPAEVQPFGEAFVAINSSAVALDNGILAFQGIDQVASLSQASIDLLNEITSRNDIITPLPQLSDENAVLLPPYVVSLAYFVNQTIFDLVEKKQVFVDTCVGPVVLDQLVQQNASASDFTATVLSKVSDDLQSIAGPLAEPINAAIESGLSAFADQTTQPASCAPTTSSTTTTATTTETSSGGAGPTGGVYPTAPVYPTGSYGDNTPTNSYPVDENNSYPVYTTSGPYPTDDCEEDDGTYPTGGDAYPTSSHAVWEPVPYPSGSSYPTGSKPSGGDSYPTGPKPSGGDSYPTGPKPSGGDSYPTGPKPSGGSSYPTGSYPAGNPSYPATTGGPKPSGGSYTTSNPVPVYTTTKITKYTGAAVANNANLGAAAVVALAAAALL